MLPSRTEGRATGGPTVTSGVVRGTMGASQLLIALAGAALPGRAGIAVGVAAGVGALGGFVVPWLTGRIATTTSLSTAFVSLAFWIALLTGSSTIVYLRRRQNRAA